MYVHLLIQWRHVDLHLYLYWSRQEGVNGEDYIWYISKCRRANWIYIFADHRIYDNFRKSTLLQYFNFPFTMYTEAFMHPHLGSLYYNFLGSISIQYKQYGKAKMKIWLNLFFWKIIFIFTLDIDICPLTACRNVSTPYSSDYFNPFLWRRHNNILLWTFPSVGGPRKTVVRTSFIIKTIYFFIEVCHKLANSSEKLKF